MTLFQDSCSEWLDNTLGVTLSGIEEGEGTVVGTSNDEIRVLVIELHAAEWRWSQKSLLWEVWVI